MPRLAYFPAAAAPAPGGFCLFPGPGNDKPRPPALTVPGPADRRFPIGAVKPLKQMPDSDMPRRHRKMEALQFLWVAVIFALYLAQFRGILPRVFDVFFS